MAVIKSIQVSSDKNMCEVVWSDSHVSRFHAMWLRCNCRCDDCRQPFPAVYRVDLLRFSEDLTINSANATDDGLGLHAHYKGDSPGDHVSIHPADWLRAKCYCDPCLSSKVEERDVIGRYITGNTMKREIPTMDNEEIRKDQDRGLFKLTKQLIEKGFCVVKNVPTEPGTIIKFTKQIACVEPSTYGELFDVFARDSENAAYTSLKLPFHQDQVYYETAPGVQLLHAIRFDECVTGGESMLVDLFEAVEVLRKETPQHFKTLVEVPAMYDTIDLNGEEPRYFEHQKCPVRLDYFGKVVEINWHPGIHCTPQVRESDMERYYAAHAALLRIIRRKEMQYRFKMDCGDLVAFNNRRMLHAREEYKSNGGTRHLQGTYVKLDDLKSKYMTLAHKLGIKVTPPKVGNSSSF